MISSTSFYTSDFYGYREKPQTMKERYEKVLFLLEDTKNSLSVIRLSENLNSISFYVAFVVGVVCFFSLVAIIATVFLKDVSKATDQLTKIVLAGMLLSFFFMFVANLVVKLTIKFDIPATDRVDTAKTLVTESYGKIVDIDVKETAEQLREALKEVSTAVEVLDKENKERRKNLNSIDEETKKLFMNPSLELLEQLVSLLYYKEEQRLSDTNEEIKALKNFAFKAADGFSPIDSTIDKVTIEKTLTLTQELKTGLQKLGWKAERDGQNPQKFFSYYEQEVEKQTNLMKDQRKKTATAQKFEGLVTTEYSLLLTGFDYKGSTENFGAAVGFIKPGTVSDENLKQIFIKMTSISSANISLSPLQTCILYKFFATIISRLFEGTFSQLTEKALIDFGKLNFPLQYGSSPWKMFLFVILLMVSQLEWTTLSEMLSIADKDAIAVKTINTLLDLLMRYVVKPINWR